GKDGQQGDRAAQEHGKQVERDGAEDGFLLPDIVEPGKQCLERSCLMLEPSRTGMKKKDRNHGDDESDDGDSVDDLRAAVCGASQAVEQAAQSRPDDGG